MENRRLLLAVFLSALILIIWNSVFPPVPPVEPPPAVPIDSGNDLPGNQAPESQTPGEATAAEDPSVAEGTALEEEPQSLLEFETETVAAEAEELPVLENETVRLQFSSRGAQLISVLLKDYEGADGEPLEMVRDRGSDPHPFALVVVGEKSHRLNNALFVWEQEEDENGDRTLHFRHKSDRGAAEKVFRLNPQGFVSVQITVERDRQWSVMLGPGLRNLTDSESGNRFIQQAVGYKRGDELSTIAQKEDEIDSIGARGLRWVTLEDNFFLMAVMPQGGLAEVIVLPWLQKKEYEADQRRFFPADTAPSEDEEEDTTKVQALLLEASGPRLEALTFFGAKRYSRLVELPYGLEDTVRWGWFGFLAKPLYFALEWIHEKIVPNYGWSIVLVTILIRLLFFPLTHKGQQSMARMQQLNPKVQAIRTKYRSKLKDKQGRPNVDAQRQMNEEVMKVYKSAGVNPMGGCLPMLLQMPVFFAFFKLLSTAVELRNAPWIGWIGDLSIPDPYYVLPILMGVTSVAMQRMMPAAPDPMQRRMMQMLPLVFMFVAFAFPSGLVLYWVTNNLLSMVQQAITTKLKKQTEAA